MSNNGIEKIDDSFESEIELKGIEDIEDIEESTFKTESTEIKTTKEYAIEKLTAKMNEGFDLSDKSERSRICHEIANEIGNITGSCSYQAVAKEVPKVLKAKKEIKKEPEISNLEGNSIIKKGIVKTNRPDRKIITESGDETQSKEELLKKFMEMEKSGDDSFEALSIQFALEDVSFLFESLGLPKPQVKKLKQRAKQIASYNNLQRSKGNHQNVIEVSDKVLKYAIYLGLFSTFAQPIIQKYFPKSDKSKSGIETTEKSLRG